MQLGLFALPVPFSPYNQISPRWPPGGRSLRDIPRGAPPSRRATHCEGRTQSVVVRAACIHNLARFARCQIHSLLSCERKKKIIANSNVCDCDLSATKVMKVTVCFGPVKVVVPCGDGRIFVKELTRKATQRYVKATGKVGIAYLSLYDSLSCTQTQTFDLW